MSGFRGPLYKSDVNITTLTQLQQAATSGRLAGLMAAYLQWLAPRMDQLKTDFPNIVTSLSTGAIRDNVTQSHTRAPGIYANLVAGASTLLDFMQDVGGMSGDQCNNVMGSIEESLKQAFSEQGAYQAEQDEVERFLALLRALFSGGHAHVSCRLNQGPPPTRQHSWGWRECNSGIGEKDYTPVGNPIGWYCEHGDNAPEVWLDQQNVFAEVQKLARAQGDSFVISAHSLWRRLHEKGLILATDKRENGTPRLTVKRQISGNKKRVMVISAELIESE